MYTQCLNKSRHYSIKITSINNLQVNFIPLEAAINILRQPYTNIKVLNFHSCYNNLHDFMFSCMKQRPSSDAQEQRNQTKEYPFIRQFTMFEFRLYALYHEYFIYVTNIFIACFSHPHETRKYLLIQILQLIYAFIGVILRTDVADGNMSRERYLHRIHCNNFLI